MLGRDQIKGRMQSSNIVGKHHHQVTPCHGDPVCYLTVPKTNLFLLNFPVTNKCHRSISLSPRTIERMEQEVPKGAAGSSSSSSTPPTKVIQTDINETPQQFTDDNNSESDETLSGLLDPVPLSALKNKVESSSGYKNRHRLSPLPLKKRRKRNNGNNSSIKHSGPVQDIWNNDENICFHDITAHDILCGRGGATNSHPGNRAFRELVKQHQAMYFSARKKTKPNVAASIVRLIRSKQGRFLKKNSGSGFYFDIGDAKALEKTCQALRENAPQIKHAITSSGHHEPINNNQSDSVTGEVTSGSHNENNDLVASSSTAKDLHQSRLNRHAFLQQATKMLYYTRRKLLTVAMEDLTDEERAIYTTDFQPPHHNLWRHHDYYPILVGFEEEPQVTSTLNKNCVIPQYYYPCIYYTVAPHSQQQPEDTTDTIVEL